MTCLRAWSGFHCALVICLGRLRHLADWLWQRSFQQSPLAWDAMFAVVITVFMGASHSALAFIYDSQKGHKRRERGWSLWLLLFATARPCLAHPLVRAGIPSLITGHPPCCRSNAAIKAVWESGAFVQLECSAINRLRTKVINCVSKEATATTEDGKESASTRLPHRLHLKGFSPWRGLTAASFRWLKAVFSSALSLSTGWRYWDQCHGRGSVRLQITAGKLLPTEFGAQMVVQKMYAHTASLVYRWERGKKKKKQIWI